MDIILDNGKQLLKEMIKPGSGKIITEKVERKDGKKDLFMEGIFIQGEVENQNGRTYPVEQIRGAVENIRKRINEEGSILGECDHPDNLNINIERVSHAIIEMRMQGNDGYGKLAIIDEMPMGQWIRTLTESKWAPGLGVSSRGSGDVNESNGNVSNFQIVTVDVVAQPSAPNAYPRPVYESMMNMKGGQHLYMMGQDAAAGDKIAKNHMASNIERLVEELLKS